MGPWLLTCVVIALRISALVGVYDWFASPYMMAKSAKKVWDMRSYQSGKVYEFSSSQNNFFDHTPSTTPASRISFKLDSLQRQIDERSSSDDADYFSTRYVEEFYLDINKYRFERYKRSANAFFVLVGYFIYALLGYAMRRLTLQKIVTAFAVLILSFVMLSQLVGFVQNRFNQNYKELQQEQKRLQQQEYERKRAEFEREREQQLDQQTEQQSEMSQI